MLLFRVLDFFAWILFLLPVAAGIGLLSVKKWGWHLFLALCVTLISYNTWVVWTAPQNSNWFALVYSALGCAGLVFMTRRDIAAPYFKLYPRGWRLQKRIPVKIDLLLNGRTLTTRDMNLAGFYADWTDSGLSAGENAAVCFKLGNEEFELPAGVARVDPWGVGVAFRGIKRSARKRLQGALKTI